MPDIGSIRLAWAFADSMQMDLAIVAKRRIDAKKVEHLALIGDVKDCDVLLIDDMCTTGATLKVAAEVCKEAGARRIFAIVTHGLLLEKLLKRVRSKRCSLAIPSLCLQNMQTLGSRLFSISSLLAKAIHAIVDGSSISSLS